MKRTFNLLLLCIFATAATVYAQPDTLWTKTFGGSFGDDYGQCVQQTSDGGYIIAGYTESYGAGGFDVYLIKTDASGNEQWSQTFGGIDDDYGYSVQETNDGGYIITGVTWPYGPGWSDVYLIKTDASGNEEWSQTFGGSYEDEGYSVQQTSDGGYIISGTTKISFSASNPLDLYLIKTDAIGDSVWTQTFDTGNHNEWGYSVQQTSDGGYIIGGSTSLGEIYLIKTDASGNEEWSQFLGGSGTSDRGYSVQQTSDGGYIITGKTGSYTSGYDDVYLIKTDASGNEEWSQTFGGSSNDLGYSVQQTSDGGYIIAGENKDYGVSYPDVYLIKTDASGNEEWSQTFGGSSTDVGKSVQQTTDGGYILAGYASLYSPGDRDVWLIRLDAETGVIDLDLPQPLTYSLLPAYPNPFNPTTVLSYKLQVASIVNLSVYDIAGRKVAELVNGWRDAGVHEVTFNGSDLASGIYVYRLLAGDFEGSGKMVLMK